jgi:hypothetical protein
MPNLPPDDDPVHAAAAVGSQDLFSLTSNVERAQRKRQPGDS